MNLLNGTTRFMLAAGQPIPDVPQIPPNRTLALRLSMLAEELDELCDAVGGLTLTGLAAARRSGEDTADVLTRWLDHQDASDSPKTKSLPLIVDAYNDITVVAWGGNIETAGIDGGYAAADEVARSNDDKVNGKHGPTLWAGEPRKSKVLKPIEQGWQGPDIAGALKDAGADL